MSWKQIWVRIIGFAGSRTAREQDLHEELRSHIEIQTDENVERGMSREEAHRAAILKFGNPQLTEEDAAAMWTLPSVESVLADVRFGWRVLWKAPGFAAVAILTLALGIGATTAIFGIAYSVLIKPLPYAAPDKLVLVHQFNKAKDQGNWRTTALDYLDWRERNHSFSGMAGYTGTGLVFSGSGNAEMVLGQRVSYNLFSVLGIAPELGRSFRYEEEEAGRDRVVVLSHGLWQRMFAGDRRVIGRSVVINNEAFTVIGVMPGGFAFPDPQYQAWIPQPFRGSTDPQWVNRSAHFLRTVARLKDGVTFAAADREMRQIASDLERQYPDTDVNEGARIESLTEQVVGDVRVSLFLLLGAAACLLLIACANIANLLLARGTAREREIAVRQALGAGTARIFRQLVTENLVLALLGGSAGCALAYGIVQAVVEFGPRDLPRIAEIHVNAATLAFALAVAIGTGIFFGLAPMLSLRKEATANALKSGGKGTVAGVGLRSVRSVLVTIEIAMSAVLLMVAALTVRSLMRLDNVDPGFNPDGAVTFNFIMTEQRFPTGAQMRNFTRRVTDEFASIPGVQAAGFTSSVPLSGNSWANPTTVEGSTESPLTLVRAISPGYFAAMQSPIRRGRAFTPSDSATSQRVAIINESAARKMFSGADAIGGHIKLGNLGSRDGWRTIVGVVADIHESGLDTAPEPALFLPYDQLGDPTTALAGRGLDMVMRTTGDPATVISFARSRMNELDRTVPINDVRMVREMVSASVAQPRFRTLLFGGFGVLAMTLAAVGLYGVLSYVVAQRTREFGIRVALGARRSNLWQIVLGEGGRLVVAGLVVGMAVAAAVAQLVRTMLFGISATDPVTFVAVAAIITFIAAVAMLVPARRAMNADPLSAIRYE